MIVATKMQKALTAVLNAEPFYATILYNLKRIECNDRPTMSTDGIHLRYNTDFVESLTPDELVGVLCHEVMHVASLHHTRSGSRDHFQWNVACDYAINSIIVDSGLTLPEDALLDDKYRGMSAEQIYSQLQCPDQPEGRPCPQGGGAGGDCDQQGQGQGQDDQESDGQQQQQQPQPQQQGQQDAGGGEKKAPDGVPQWGQVEKPTNDDGSAMSESDLREVEENVKITLQEAVTAAKRQGKLPAGIERLVEEIMEPKVDWRAYLSRFLSDFARSDYSFRFPNKRFIQSGVIMPGLKNETFGDIVFGVDTSGSMSEKDMNDVLSEAGGVMRELEQDGKDPTIKVLWADTEVHEQDVSDADEFKPTGCGGTMYKPVFDYIEENEINAKCVVYLTDGYCDDYDYDPGLPVLWALTSKCRSFEPPFGEVVVINQ